MLMLWLIVLALVILGGFLSRVRHGGSQQPQSLEQLETEARVARSAVEQSSHLLNAVQQTAQSCGMGSNVAVLRLEGDLRQRMKMREAQRDIAEVCLKLERQSHLAEKLVELKARLQMLTATNARPTTAKDSGSTGQQL